jgi:hypothetical protein
MAGPDGVKYLLVKVPIEAGPVGGAASSVSQIKVSEFDMKPPPATP